MTRTTGIPHGTTTGYAHYKCRCDECRAAVAQYQRRRKAAMKAGTWEPDPARGRPARQMCVGPGCGRLARYVTPIPLCMTHKQQRDRGKELTVPRKVRLVGNGKKECSQCEQVLPLESFNRQLNRVQSKCKACTSIYTRARKYGLSFEAMAELVQHSCSGCARTERLHVDHDHDTGKVRGMLCNRCNTVLMEHMTPTILRALADYLEAST